MQLALKYIYALVIVLCLVSGVYGVVVEATANYVVRGTSTVDVVVNNPAQAAITIKITNSSGNAVVNSVYTSKRIEKTYTFNKNDVYTILIYQGGQQNIILQDKFVLGSIIDTGFKSKMKEAFGGSLVPIIIITVLAITFWSIGIGRYAGVPVLVLGLVIFAKNDYIASWPITLIMVVSGFALGYGLYHLSGGARG